MYGDDLMRECVCLRDDWETYCRASVMFWGCIFYYGVGTLVPAEGNMNTERHISVLDDNLLPVFVKYFSNRRWMFQEDNAQCHVSARANQWKLKMILTLFNDVHRTLILTFYRKCSENAQT